MSILHLGGGAPLISIIIPCFNVETYIKQCIDSCLNNTYGNFEIILVNDGSSDNTKKVIESYLLDKRIKFIDKYTSEGVSKARNDGLDVASGEYILFLDSDDWIDADSLSIYIDAIKETDADFIVGRRCVVIQYSDKEDQYHYNPLIINSCYTNEEIFNDLFAELIGYSTNDIDEWNQSGYLKEKAFDKGFCTGIIYKKSIIDGHEIRFNESITVKEDTFFNLNYLLYANNLETVDKTIYFYRIRADRTNTVAMARIENKAAYLNKIARNKTLKNLRDRVKQEKNEDILSLYAGSSVLSMIEVSLLCNKIKALKYADYKQYIYSGSLKEAVRLIKFSFKNIKFNAVLLMAKWHMYWFIYFIIKIICKLNLDSLLNVNKS